jgi:hypothetical protein
MSQYHPYPYTPHHSPQYQPHTYPQYQTSSYSRNYQVACSSGSQHQNPSRHGYREVADRQAISEEVVYRDSVCRLCSDDSHTARHHHISSEASRAFAMKYQGGYRFYCIMCKGDESVVRPSTRKVLLTTSTLYNVWSYEQLKLPLHIDIESIVGGRIRDLTRALIMQYLNHPERLEIIVVAGLNNIGDNQPVPDIIDEIMELKEAVQAHSKHFKHKEASIVTISTVLFAPKFCSLDVPANQTDWIPPAGFRNRRHETECLNAAITAINRGAGVNTVNIHLEGIRVEKATGKVLHKHNPGKQVWREAEVRRRLHLTPEYKVKVMGRIAKLYKGGLKNLGNWSTNAE